MKDIFADAEYSGDSALEQMKQKLIGEPIKEVPSQQQAPSTNIPTKPYSPTSIAPTPVAPTDLTIEFNRLNPKQRAQLTDGAFSDSSGNISLQSVNDPELKMFEGMKINQKQATSVPLYPYTTLSAPTGNEVSREQYRPDEQTNPFWEFGKSLAKSGIESGRSILGIGEMILDGRLDVSHISSLKQNLTDFLVEHPELEPSNRVPKTLSEGWKNPDYIAGALGSIIPSIAGTVGATIAGGPAAGYTFAFSQEAGSTYNDLVESGVNKKQAAVASTLYGSVAAVLENAFPNQIASKFFNPAHVVASSAKGAAVQFVKNLPKESVKYAYSALKEGGTEALQQLAQNFTKKYFNANQDIWAGVPESAFAGALGGFGTDLVTDVFAGHARNGENVDVNRPIRQQEGDSTIAKQKKPMLANLVDLQQKKEGLSSSIQMAEEMNNRTNGTAINTSLISEAKQQLQSINSSYSNALNEYFNAYGFSEVDTPNVKVSTAEIEPGQWVAQGKAMVQGQNYDVPYTTSDIFPTSEEATRYVTQKIQDWVQLQQSSPQLNDVTGLASVSDSLEELAKRPTLEQALQNKQLVLAAQDMTPTDFLAKYAGKHSVETLRGIYSKAQDIRVQLKTKELAVAPIRQLAKDLGVGIQWVDHIATVDGRRALGSYQNQVIKLLQDKNGNPVADASIAWHEIGHAYLRTVMTQDQRNSVLDQVKAQHSITSDLNAEEKLVEDLKAYADGKMDTQTKYGKFIGKLIDVVKKFTNWVKGDKVSQFYEDVIAGKKPSEQKAMTDAELQDRAQQHEEKVAQLKEKVSKELEDKGIDMNQFAMHRVEDGAEFAANHYESKDLKKQYGDADSYTVFRLEKDIFNEYDNVKAEQIGQMIEIMNMRPMNQENAKSYENLVKYAHEFNQQLINKYGVGFPADMMNQINKANGVVDEYLGTKHSYETQAQDKNTGMSRVSERMKALYPELDDPVLYDKININEEVSKAVDLVEKDQVEAYRKAIGIGDVTPYQSTAASIALTEKALADGNFGLANSLIKQRSKMQTSYGQSIAMEKATVNDNSAQRYLSDLVTTRLQKLGESLPLTKLEKQMNKTIEQKVREHIDNKVREAKNNISKEKVFDIKQAQDFISSLACK